MPRRSGKMAPIQKFALNSASISSFAMPQTRYNVALERKLHILHKPFTIATTNVRGHTIIIKTFQFHSREIRYGVIIRFESCKRREEEGKMLLQMCSENNLLIRL